MVYGRLAGVDHAVEIDSVDELPAVLQAIMDASVEPVLDVDVEPVTTLTNWRYVRVHYVNGLRTRHLVGWAEYEGRVCSAIVQIEAVDRRLTTRSGRVYQLEGPSGRDDDAEWTFRRWLSFQHGITSQCDQTKALERVLARAQGRATAGEAPRIIHGRDR